MTEILITSLLAISIYVIAFYNGYSLGVKHTEERWSDAVNKKKNDSIKMKDFDREGW